MSSTHVLSGAMQDGRFFTNYMPACRLNSKMAEDANIPSWNSTQYREYLQSNGLQMIKSIHSPTPCGTLDCDDHGKSISPPADSNMSLPYSEDPEL